MHERTENHKQQQKKKMSNKNPKFIEEEEKTFD